MLAAQTAPNAAFATSPGFEVKNNSRDAIVFQPGARAAVVTAIDLNQAGLSNTSAANLFLWVSTSAVCTYVSAAPVATLTFLNPAPGNLQIPLVFPSGLSIRAGHTLCAYLANYNGSTADLTVAANINGHYIPAAACTTLACSSIWANRGTNSGSRQPRSDSSSMISSAWL